MIGVHEATAGYSTARLRQILRWAGSPNLPFSVVLGVMWMSTGVDLVGLLAVVVLLNAGVAHYSARVADQGRTERAVYVYSAGVWMIALVVMLGGADLYGITSSLMVIPVVIAMPFVPGRAIVTLGVIAAVFVGLAGLPVIADWDFRLDQVSEGTVDGIVAVAMVSLAVSLALSVWHTRLTLDEVRRELEETNRALSASERRLEERVAERVAELEEASRELAVTRDRALTANRHKSEFLANMSHELRTPLNAIVGFSEVLGEEIFGDLEAKQLEYCTDIHESGHQLLALINNILDIAKIEAGRWDLDVGPVDLVPLATDTVAAHQAHAAAAGVALTGPTTSARLEAQGDESALRRVVDALIDNAIKFTPPDGLVDVEVQSRDGINQVVVRDTGIGLSAADLEVVFDEFRQAEAHYTHKREGTGLGLALARRLTELHGGTIAVVSEQHEGSEFVVCLPSGGPRGE